MVEKSIKSEKRRCSYKLNFIIQFCNKFDICLKFYFDFLPDTIRRRKLKITKIHLEHTNSWKSSLQFCYLRNSHISLIPIKAVNIYAPDHEDYPQFVKKLPQSMLVQKLAGLIHKLYKTGNQIPKLSYINSEVSYYNFSCCVYIFCYIDHDYFLVSRYWNPTK